MAQVSGSLITRNYVNFRGVDFSNRKDEVSYVRSPDAKNMWKNYKNSKGRCVESRPDVEIVKEFTDTIFGLFFYTYNKASHTIVHSGTKLYDNDKVIYSNMAKHKSQAFIYNDKLYIKDGTSYLVYDGTAVKDVEGFIPTTTMGRSPNGGGTVYQDVNLLTGIRKNSFVADGTSKDYIVDAESFDTDYTVKVWVNDKEVTSGFKVDASTGKITFDTAPAEPNTVGQDNVVIQFKKEIEGYRDKIEKCTLLEVFDNRVFFSGNPDYPNMLWHCSLEDPGYCSDLDYYQEGVDDAKIKALISGNNALWVMKEPSQTNTTIFYHTPTIDDELGKVYPSTHSSISTGCVATGTNFNDDIVFFSERGLEGISGDVTTEQVIAHRSTLVDNKLLNEANYKNLIIEEWEGYLLAIIDKHIYLADSRAMMTNGNHNEYEWFYWEFNIDIIGTRVKDGVLYLFGEEQVKENGVYVTKHRIYTLTKTDTNIEAYWTTLEDEFGYAQYQKTTNKKGCVIDMEGKSLTISVKTDNKNFEIIKKYENTKGYIAARIKKKKWKSIQLKFSSDKPFGLFSSTLEAYVGSYVKR
jgi:hypothetical protein